MKKNENELKKIYIDTIKKLNYDFSLEEIEQIYRLVQWRWQRSPVVNMKIEKIIEKNRRLEI